MLIFLAGGSVWLKNWSEVNGKAGKNPQVGKYLGIYFALGIGSSGLVVVQTLILWIFCSIEVSSRWQRRRAFCKRTCNFAEANLHVPAGIKEASRENGFRDLQISYELF
jgi:hypothetical protein